MTTSHLKRKKGVINNAKYNRNIIKQAKVQGKEHTNWVGKIVTIIFEQYTFTAN